MIRKIVSSVKKVREAFEDQNLGRQLVGIDRHGNKYYQYYEGGKPTKRMSERVDKLAPFVDPFWEEWIRHQRDKPYTLEEILEIEKKQADYQKTVRDYEAKEEELLKQNKRSKTDWNKNKY